MKLTKFSVIKNRKFITININDLHWVPLMPVQSSRHYHKIFQKIHFNITLVCFDLSDTKMH
jgi:hypothetical protein